MNLSDLYSLFNCVRAGFVGGTNHREGNFIWITLKRIWIFDRNHLIKNVPIRTFALHLYMTKRTSEKMPRNCHRSNYPLQSIGRLRFCVILGHKNIISEIRSKSFALGKKERRGIWTVYLRISPRPFFSFSLCPPFLPFSLCLFLFLSSRWFRSVFRPQFAGRCSKLKTLRLLRPWSASPTRLLGTKIAGYRAAFHRAFVKFSPLGRSVDAIAPNKVTDGLVIEQPPAASRGCNLRPDCSTRACA